jgi:large subunit ribosomal protein L9
MEIILIQDVENLGHQHDQVKVRNGYARNFLIPRKLAIEASPGNLKRASERLKVLKVKDDRILAEIAKVKEVLSESPVKIGAKVGTSEKIFGSVTSVQISQAIKAQKGYEIDRRHIQILDEVKELGTYRAKIDFGKGNELELHFEVVAE